MTEWKDAHGQPIKVGDRVITINAYNPGYGAMHWMVVDTLHHGHSAEVVGFAQTRVKLYFPKVEYRDGALDKVGRTANVDPDYLVVIEETVDG